MMHTILRHTYGSSTRRLARATLLSLVCLAQWPAAAATLPASPACTAPGGGTVTCTLWATSGSVALPDQSVGIWGYTTDGALSTLPGGPVLIANQGDTVTVTLRNNLAEATGLLFQGQAMAPDTMGVAAGGDKTYTFVASHPGTYLYEAGLLPNAEHQVAMGLYGALVVRPAATTQAYADATTAFDDEAVLVLSEIDPALNTSANPAAFDMRNFAPKYFLINGKAYPGTAPINSSGAGKKVLLRYVNAGAKHHSMAVLGLRQNFVAKDASLLPTLTHNVAAETLAPGQTGDAIATVPASATTASKFAVYDASLMLHNNGAAGFGGMLTFVTAGSGTGPSGPVVTALSLMGNNLSATIEASTGSVAAAEYWFDSALHNAILISPAPTVTITNLPVTLPASTGSHTLYVRGQDGSGIWGAPRSVAFLVDTSGPLTSGLTLTPNPSSGTVAVALHGTGNDTTTGGSNITAAEYFIGTPGLNGTGKPMTVNVAATIASLDATLPAPVAAGVVSVHSQDALGLWGPFATITLNVVASGPVTSLVSADKNPNNGSLPLNSSQPVVRVTATMTSVGSTVAGAEGFIDTPPASVNVRGFPFVPKDGAWNSTTEVGTSDIPLATINALSAGNHTIYVRGKDAAGNWGVTSTVVILIDKTAPTFTGISIAPSTVSATASVMMAVNGAADPLLAGLASGVAGGEYWIGPTAPAPGGGTPFTGLTPSVPVGALAKGTYTIGARIRDLAGNWSATTHGATLVVQVPDVIFSDGFETGTLNPLTGWSSRSTTIATRLNVTTAAALVGTYSLQAQGNNINYVQYNFGTTANPAWSTFDARFYFNPNGNTGTNQDIFAASTTGNNAFNNNRLFRTRYRWNGGFPQVQIQVGTGPNTSWVNITNNASNVIEVVWQSGSTLQLYVNGVLSQTLTAGTGSIAAVRLGSVTSGGNPTLEYFDGFSAKRSVSPLIGP